MNEITSFSRAYKIIYRIGGTICMIFIIYSLVTMLLLVIIGPPPKTVEECFSMLHENRVKGLLRLDILTVFILPLYYLLFLSIFLALKDTDQGLAAVSIVLVFAGLTLVLETQSVFSLLKLSDKFSDSATPLQKNQLLTAGESIMASDMWHGYRAKIGGLLLQSGAVLISIAMLKTGIFNRLTALAGILTHGLDLFHIILGLFLPGISRHPYGNSRNSVSVLVSAGWHQTF